MASEFKFLDKTEAFFDDDIDNAQIRYEEGEDMEHYGLRDATQEEIDQAIDRGNDDPCCQKPTADEYDFRMEGHGGASSNAQPRAKWNGKSQNTGPKGVKKDYEDAKKATRINREIDALRRERLIRQHVSGKKMWYLDNNNQVRGYTRQVDESGKSVEPEKDEEHEGRGKFRHSRLEDASTDEEYLRLKRQREQQLQFYQDEIIERQADLCGMYVRAANLDTVATMLAQGHPDAISILHVYDNANPVCQVVHLIMEDLAQMFQHVMFFRARQEEILPNFDKRFLPTLIIYKGTKKISEIIGCGTIWGLKPDDEQVVKTLAEGGWLQMPTNGLEKPAEAELRRNFLTQLDDDDDSWLDAED